MLASLESTVRSLLPASLGGRSPQHKFSQLVTEDEAEAYESVPLVGRRGARDEEEA